MSLDKEMDVGDLRDGKRLKNDSDFVCIVVLRDILPTLNK